jgi:hypothetical protein
MGTHWRAKHGKRRRNNKTRQQLEWIFEKPLKTINLEARRERRERARQPEDGLPPPF